MLKAPGTKRLELKYDELLSSFAFKFNLRRYFLDLCGIPDPDSAHCKRSDCDTLFITANYEEAKVGPRSFTPGSPRVDPGLSALGLNS